MGLSQIVSDFFNKKKEDKEMERRMIEEARIQQKIEVKKMTPQERQLAFYYKQKKNREDKEKLKQIRLEQEYDGNMLRNPVNAPNIFKNVPPADLKSTHKPLTLKQKNIFAGHNIFNSQPTKLRHERR